MAVTILEEPQELQPVNNPYIYVMDSTNKNQPKFEYVVKPRINGVAFATLKIQSNPQGYGVIDLSKHLQNYVSFDLPTVDIFKEGINSNVLESIEVAERYTRTYTFTNVADNGGNAKITITNHSLTVGDFITISAATEPTYNGIHEVVSVEDTNNFTIDKTFSINSSGILVRTDGGATTQDFNIFGGETAINNVLKHNTVWDWTEYYLGGSGGLFFTNLPYDSKVRLEDRVTFNIREGSTGNFLKVLTSNGKTYHFENTPSFRFMAVGVGPNQLNSGTLASGLLSNSLPVVDADVEWYTVEMIDATETTVSEVKKFTIDRTCGEGTTLTYLNTGGSWSVFHFWGARSKQVSNDKTKYRKNVGAFDGVSTYGYAKSDRGTTTVHTEVKEVHTINTLYLRPNEGDLITDLINSPEVYEVVNNELIAIDIDTNSVKVKQRKIDKLISYTLNFQYANKNLAQ